MQGQENVCKILFQFITGKEGEHILAEGLASLLTNTLSHLSQAEMSLFSKKTSLIALSEGSPTPLPSCSPPHSFSFPS